MVTATVSFRGDPTDDDGMAVHTSFGVYFELELEMVGKPLRIAPVFRLLSPCCGADQMVIRSEWKCMKCHRFNAIDVATGGVMDPERLIPAMEKYALDAGSTLDPIHRVLLIREAIAMAEERALAGGPYKKITRSLEVNHG